MIQDKDWRLINPSLNYSDYTLQYSTQFVMRAGSGFVMYLRAGNVSSGVSDIYRGTSQDGANWSIAPTPVLSTGANGTWDSSVVFSPDVVWNGTGYMMYYVGDGETNQTTYPANFRQIGVAFSSDGITWTKYAGNPVITHGPGVYDARYTRGPNVIYDNGSYKMWYFGTPPLAAFSNYTSNIDYATSADGLHWTKYAGNPVLTGFNYSGSLVAHSPSVLKVNGTYLMAFSDGFANIGYATSADGIRWNFNNGTNVLESLSGWHNGYVDFPSLVIVGNRLFLWFDGAQNMTQLPRTPYVAGIGLATCGLAVIPPPVVTVSSTTSTATVTKSVVSTLMSTSTVSSTLVVNPSAPFVQVAIAGVVGFASAMAVAVALLVLRLKGRRAP